MWSLFSLLWHFCYNAWVVLSRVEIALLLSGLSYFCFTLEVHDAQGTRFNLNFFFFREALSVLLKFSFFSLILRGFMFVLDFTSIFFCFILPRKF